MSKVERYLHAKEREKKVRLSLPSEQGVDFHCARGGYTHTRTTPTIPRRTRVCPGLSDHTRKSVRKPPRMHLSKEAQLNSVHSVDKRRREDDNLGSAGTLWQERWNSALSVDGIYRATLIPEIPEKKHAINLINPYIDICQASKQFGHPGPFSSPTHASPPSAFKTLRQNPRSTETVPSSIIYCK